MPKHLPLLSAFVLLLAAAPASAQRGSASLPEGPGKDLVESVCTTCHGTFHITRSVGYDTAEEWRAVMETMIDLADPQAETIAEYLAEHFPANEERRPTLVDGDTEIEIREWDSPSGPDSHPYALAVIDDVIWYNESGMRPDALVRFDPGTEQFQSWAIPSGVGIVRRMWVTEDDNLLIHQSSSNRVGRVMIP